MEKSWLSVAGLTFVYAIALAAIMQAAHTLTRLILSLALAISSAALLDPLSILGELVAKVSWSVLACEAVVLVSILTRRGWILTIAAAGVSVMIGALVGAYLRASVEMLLGRASALVWPSALDASAMMSAKYLLVGAAIAWANRVAESTWRHYVAAGLVAALGASAITLLALNADWIAKLGTVAIDFVFPMGCSAVVWKVRQVVRPLVSAHRQSRELLKNY